MSAFLQIKNFLKKGSDPKVLTSRNSFIPFLPVIGLHFFVIGLHFFVIGLHFFVIGLHFFVIGLLSVIPAKAGIHKLYGHIMGPRLRGDDREKRNVNKKKGIKKNLWQSILILLLITATNATAQDKTQIPIPITKNFQEPFLIGKAKLNFLGFKVYDIELWSEDLNFSYQKKSAIFIKYNMNFKKEDLAKRSIDEIKLNHNLSQLEEENYLKKLNEIFVNIKKGDEKIALFNPNSGVILFHNNKEIGQITNLKFARLFIDIWLDERGSYPKITKQLLGK